MANLILYDGVCGLCNRLVRFALQRDRHDQFRFATLQSQLAGEVRRRYGKDSSDLDTFYLIVNHGQLTERLISKGRGILLMLRILGGVWFCTMPLGWLPTR